MLEKRSGLWKTTEDRQSAVMLFQLSETRFQTLIAVIIILFADWIKIQTSFNRKFAWLATRGKSFDLCALLRSTD